MDPLEHISKAQELTRAGRFDEAMDELIKATEIMLAQIDELGKRIEEDFRMALGGCNES